LKKGAYRVQNVPKYAHFQNHNILILLYLHFHNRPFTPTTPVRIRLGTPVNKNGGLSVFSDPRFYSQIISRLPPCLLRVFKIPFYPVSTLEQETNMPTPDQCKASYHCGIGELLRAAYQREFSMLEMGRARPNFLLLMNGMQP
jgi:hypothetical protein